MTVRCLRTTRRFRSSLIENNKTVPFIADLMEKRRAKYEAAADIVIETDGKSELEICEEMIHRLREADANK